MIKNSKHTRSCSVPQKSAFIEQLENRLLLAAPPAPAPISPGTIYYLDKIKSTTHSHVDSYNGLWSMKGDGSAKTLVTPGHTQDLSRLLHGKRWGLGTQPVEGTYPNGRPRQELFAFEIDGPQKVQLTDDPFVQPFYSNWSMDDSFVSFSAVTWKQDGQGDETYTATDGEQWDLDAGIFRAPVIWAGRVPDAGSPSEALDAGLRFTTDHRSFWPNVVDMQWSPDGTRLVYGEQLDQGIGPLYSVDFATEPDTVVLLGSGRDAEWKPDGSLIVFSGINSANPKAANSVIKTVNPAGTVFTQLVKTLDYDSDPSWSPDGKQIVFSRHNISKFTNDVMRVAAAGGTVTNLTSSLANNAYAFAWRADVQANDPPAAIVTATAPAAAPIAASTTLFSDEPVDDAEELEDEPLLGILA
jgi:hypothetical protein